jgi:hypothetical protein
MQHQVIGCASLAAMDNTNTNPAAALNTEGCRSPLHWVAVGSCGRLLTRLALRSLCSLTLFLSVFWGACVSRDWEMEHLYGDDAPHMHVFMRMSGWMRPVG